MSIKLKDTIYDLVNKSIKDSSGNTITSTYLNKTKSETVTGDITLSNSSGTRNLFINGNTTSLKLFAWDTATFIESGNADFSSNVPLKVTGISGNTGSDLYLNFSNIYCRGSYYVNIDSGNYSSYAATKDHTHSGYAASSHTHPDLPLSGGTMTGGVTFPDGSGSGISYLNMNNSDISGVNSIKMADTCQNGSEGIQFIRSNGNYDSIYATDGILYFSVNGTSTWPTTYTVYHNGNLSLSNYVTKNGTGATGTWGINISGSAATLEHKNLSYTEMDNLSGTFVYSAILSDSSDTSGIQIGDSATKFQLDAPLSGSLRFRVNDTGGTNSTSWSSWVNILHTGNYTSYCAALSHSHSYASKVTVGSTAYSVSSNNITIPAYPTTLACPAALTISLNGNSQGAWTGSAAKTINITPSSIGAAASSHSHSYLPLSGGSMSSGACITFANGNGATTALALTNSNISGVNAIYTADNAESGAEGIQFARSNGNYDSIWASSGILYFSPNGNSTYSTNYTVLTSGNYTSYCAPTSHSHTKLNNYYSSRPSSIAPGISGDGSMFHFKCTSSVTDTSTDTDPGDAHILHFNWDNTGGYDFQIAGLTSQSTLKIRGMQSGTWLGWATVLTSSNWSSYCASAGHTHSYLPLTGGTINNGALNMTNNRLRMVGTQATPAWNQAGAITWCEDTSDSQAVSIVYTSYDSYRNPAGLKVCGVQGNEWFEAPRVYCTNLYIGGEAITFTT